MSGVIDVSFSIVLINRPAESTFAFEPTFSSFDLSNDFVLLVALPKDELANKSIVCKGKLLQRLRRDLS